MTKEEALFRFKFTKECLEKGYELPYNELQFKEMVDEAIKALERYYE